MGDRDHLHQRGRQMAFAMGPRAAEARCAPAGAPTRRSRPCRARLIRSRSSNWRTRSGNDEGSGDFVTDLVGKIFGKDVLADPEPFGLKRMTKEEWPDQWPANTTDFDVEPLETDDTVELREVVRPVLKQTQMEFLELGLAYDANVHGWSASSFHTQMDGQGAGLLVGVTDSGQTFGGYNPRVSSHNNQHIHPPSVHPDVSDPLAAPSPSFCLHRTRAGWATASGGMPSPPSSSCTRARATPSSPPRWAGAGWPSSTRAARGRSGALTA